MPRKTKKGKAIKPMYNSPSDDKPISADERAHVYLAEDKQYYDQHIEHLWEDCFYGRELDEIFRCNFRQYFPMLTGHVGEVPDAVFEDYGTAASWVARNFGLLAVRELAQPPAEALYSHCRFEAKLRTPLTKPTPCRAPTALHAALLAVCNVFRELAREPINRRMRGTGAAH